MPVVEEYWAGVLRRLQAEVDVFSRLIRHNGEMGRENEAALARLLESFVPTRIGVGTGMVIDNLDRYSKQTDIVLFEQSDEPAILAQATQLIYPVENVLAAIEVKTTLRSDDLTDIAAKKRSLANLTPTVPHVDGSTSPLFMVLAYDSALSPEAIGRRLKDESEDGKPDVICVLDPGLYGGRSPILNILPQHTSYGLGVALLREAVDGRRIGPPVELSEEEASTSLKANVEGHNYPILGSKEPIYVTEPARALLLFVETLARSMNTLQGRRDPVMSFYLDEHSKELLWLYAG